MAEAAAVEDVAASAVHAGTVPNRHNVTPVSVYANLAWTLSGTPPTVPPPSVLTRTDGMSVLYPEKVNILFGDPESAKTWIAKLAVLECLAAGRRAAMVDVDHNGAVALATDLMKMGADPAVLADRTLFRIAEPQDRNELEAVIRDLTVWRPDVVVVDSIGEMLPMMGADSNNNDDCARALRLTLTRLSMCGAAVLAIDHVAKSRVSGVSFAIGAIAKKRACNGTMLHVATEPGHMFAPGRVGRAKITIKKDRPGLVRANSERGMVLGTFILDSTRGHTIVARIEPSHARQQAADGEQRPVPAMERVSVFLAEQSVPVSQRKIEAGVVGKSAQLRRAVIVLGLEGYVTHGPAGWSLVRPFPAKGVACDASERSDGDGLPF